MFYNKRSTWEQASYRVKLNSPATGAQILEALKQVFPALNRLAAGPPANGNRYIFGTAEYEYRIDDRGRLHAGSWGEYPSANLLLLVGNGPIDPEKRYSEGAQLVFIHIMWNGKPWTMELRTDGDDVDAFYVSVRRCAASCLERVLRQRGH